LIDEAALHGVLAKVRDLNVRLLAVQILEDVYLRADRSMPEDTGETTLDSAQDSRRADSSEPKPRRKQSRRKHRKDRL
jgi:hypothetical protein